MKRLQILLILLAIADVAYTLLWVSLGAELNPLALPLLVPRVVLVLVLCRWNVRGPILVAVSAYGVIVIWNTVGLIALQLSEFP